MGEDLADQEVLWPSEVLDRSDKVSTVGGTLVLRPKEMTYLSSI